MAYARFGELLDAFLEFGLIVAMRSTMIAQLLGLQGAAGTVDADVPDSSEIVDKRPAASRVAIDAPPVQATTATSNRLKTSFSFIMSSERSANRRFSQFGMVLGPIAASSLTLLLEQLRPLHLRRHQPAVLLAAALECRLRNPSLVTALGY